MNTWSAIIPGRELTHLDSLERLRRAIAKRRRIYGCATCSSTSHITFRHALVFEKNRPKKSLLRIYSCATGNQS